MKRYVAAFFIMALMTAAPARAEEVYLGAEAESGENQTPNTDIQFVKNQRGGALYLMLGNSNLDLDALNSRLSANGFSTVEKNFAMFGIGGHAIMDEWIVGGEIHWMNRGKAASSAYHLYMNGGYFLVNAGYVLRRADTYMLYPMAGIGLGTLSLDIQSPTVPAFDLLLANPQSGTQLYRTLAVFNVAIAADGLAPVLRTANGVHMPFTFGFRAGYLFSTPIGGWQSLEGEADGGPAVGFTGPYLQVILGLGFMVG